MAEGCPNEDQGNESSFVLVRLETRVETSNAFSTFTAAASSEASFDYGGDHLGPRSDSTHVQPHTAVPPRRRITTCESAGDLMKLTDFEGPDGVMVNRKLERECLTLKLQKATPGAAIAIVNETKELRLQNGTVYFQSGTSRSLLPAIDTETALFYSAYGLRGVPWPTGAAGCICYDIYHVNGKYLDGVVKLAIMFSVPYNRIFYRNWWNVKVYTKNNVQEKQKAFGKASKGMFKDLYNRRPGPYKGNNSHHEFYLTDNFKVRGFMSDTETAKIIISIYNILS